MLTIQALLDEVGLELATARHAGGTRVRWVHSTELSDPTPWLSGGELVLTTGIQLEDGGDLEAYVRRLVAHGIAGLGLGTGFRHPRLPAALVSAAESAGLPLFEVPYELPFLAITERASAHLVNEQYDSLRRSVALQGRLERLVLEERGLPALMTVLAEAVGGMAGVLSARGDILAAAQVGAAAPLRAAEELEAVRAVLRRRGALRRPAPEPFEVDAPRKRRALALPVVIREHAAPGAWLVALAATGALGDFERLILKQTVTVVALELMRLRVRRDTERRLAGDVLAEALTGRLDADELQLRLQPFGIKDRAAVLAFALRDPVAAEPILDRLLTEAGVGALVSARGDLLCAVIDAGAGGADALELAAVARQELTAAEGEVRAAVSRPAPTRELRRSFHEARWALEAARAVNGGAPEVATHRDLGVFALLLSVQDDDALRSYCRTVLEPVQEGDGGYGDELLRSLDAFIEHNGHWERAAHVLCCHRHTLRYRIRRVEQLTGRDLSSARDRIEFWLALRGRELAR
jgi:purine catabolism regulator